MPKGESMKSIQLQKYKPYPAVGLSDRVWPTKTIEKAPAWCSVDLRDGNQALIQPMNLEQKVRMFKLLVDIGFKEIEVGFPSASEVEYQFCRKLIDDNLIPEDVTIQVLTQAREHLIVKTFEALRGAKKAIIHLYNSTSTLQRKVVFAKSRGEIVDLAIEGARLVQAEALKYPATEFRYEYSPESFTGTELDYALEICEAVLAVWQPTSGNKVIINLPATVEMSTPNVYADQIEWFCRNVSCRDAVLISLHAHNDRGCAVAATELGLMAGGDRVEGTLFGNGERTGNVDLVTLGLNLFTQGVDPKIDFSDINGLIEVYQEVTNLEVHPRHPYAGELVYTAFSGSHQDAINKGINMYREAGADLWQVPYLPIDPTDVGRSYESIIRINSQSGKGGVAYIMDQEYGYKLPKAMRPEFGNVVQAVTEKEGRELRYPEIFSAFEEEYLSRQAAYRLKDFQVVKRHVDEDAEKSSAEVVATLLVNGEEQMIWANGNGPVDAFCAAVNKLLPEEFHLHSYHEHALKGGSSAQAAAYVEIEMNSSNTRRWGVGVDTDIIIASIKAVLSCLNRL
ncbi:probable 2-isopropylmalate synthase [Desulfotalea psychrophila LSv54]|uniref:2-isopropylmalate synthase n=1 Tax=Desulfotalea psychrophila (strain LSv54 / DSM 12343) TaxID=177439 RepID=Q6AJI3_DESPS|nr:probable 2-isopropylmalate synthase [Desulfotalea psychrophila LSv54]